MRKFFGIIFCVLIQFSPAEAQNRIEGPALNACSSKNKCVDAAIQILKDKKDLFKADEELRKCCSLSDASDYTMICLECDTKLLHHPIKEFSVKHKETSTLSSKGDNKVYSILELKEIVSGKLAVFDSLVLDFSNMPVNERSKAITLYFMNEQEKIIPYYDPQTQTLVISKKLFSNRDIMYASLNAFYIDNGAEKPIKPSFQLYFITDKEKEEIVRIAGDLKKVDTSIFENTVVIEYFEDIISNKYERVDSESLNTWFALQKY